MNRLVLLFVFAFSTLSAHAVELLVDYSAGFQAGWSTLKIYDNGEVVHTERVCCHTNEDIVIPENKLTAAEVKELKNLISDVITDSDKMIVKTNVDFSLGSRSGFLNIYSNGEKTTARELERTSTVKGNIRYIPTDAAQDFEKWVYEIADVQNTLAF